jgi:hypothetical protein
MSAKKSQRLTVRSHNIEFLKILAVQMAVEDLSEVLNYLLLDVKGLSYKFGDKPAPQTQPQQVSIGFDASTFESAFVPSIDDDRNERNHIEIDPTIQRLLDSGLELDF